MTIKISDDMTDASFVVCTRASDPSPFPDNVFGVCALCGIAVQHRPHVPEGLAKACVVCYEKMREPGDGIVVSPQSVVELLHVAGVKTKFADCCIAGFVAWGAATGFQLSAPGTRFTCPGCGRIYGLIERRPGDAPMWTLLEYGVQ